MDSSWSMLESDSPSPPPPLPPPLGLETNNTVNTNLSAGSSDNQRVTPSLPPPLFGQYPPYQPNDQRALMNLNNPVAAAAAATTGQPLYNQHSSLTTYNPYANSFQRRRQAYDSRNNGVISKIAEEKTRSAFNSIEVILDTFSSLSAILENTYSAIYGSFRTITNVADHIIFLRNHLAELALLPRALQIISRFIKWLLQAVGFGQSSLAQRLDDRLKSQIWNESLGLPGDDDHSKIFNDIDSSSNSAWPILAFISLVFGTPYLVRKLLGAPPDVIPRTNRPQWTTRSGHHYIAVGLHDFTARNSNELSFTKDAALFVKPESMQPGSKWFIATLAVDDPTSDPRKAKPIGLIPVSYVRILMK